jgi:hypothetical protein
MKTSQLLTIHIVFSIINLYHNANQFFFHEVFWGRQNVFWATSNCSFCCSYESLTSQCNDRNVSCTLLSVSTLSRKIAHPSGRKMRSISNTRFSRLHLHEKMGSVKKVCERQKVDTDLHHQFLHCQYMRNCIRKKVINKPQKIKFWVKGEGYDHNCIIMQRT